MFLPPLMAVTAIPEPEPIAVMSVVAAAVSVNGDAAPDAVADIAVKPDHPEVVFKTIPPAAVEVRLAV